MHLINTPGWQQPLARLCLTLATTSLLALSGCTWVKPTDAAAMVTVASADDVAGCTRLGQTGARTADSIGPINRNRSKVTLELETLARNEAAAMGGDTVVPVAEKAANGAGVYLIFLCQPATAGAAEDA